MVRRQMTKNLGITSTAWQRRLLALDVDHRRGIQRFADRLSDFEARGLLSAEQRSVVTEFLLRLGERRRNPANTGNIEDLFCHTLEDTQDPIRAFAQAIADSVKVVPMDQEAPLLPTLCRLDRSKRYEKVGALDHLSAGDKMLVAHTMVAYGDAETWAAAASLVRATHPGDSAEAVDQAVAKMAVQSQHLPSSSFVLARAAGLTIDCEPLYRRAGYDFETIQNAQRFYDVCGSFLPRWSEAFVDGQIPDGPDWEAWRGEYLASRTTLPPELVYQLASDTLTNFMGGTLESGKWTDASVFFNGVTAAVDVPRAIARIVNQYIAEHVALHDRPPHELTLACAETLMPWGVGFEQDRAVVLPTTPEKAAELEAQFAAAWARKNVTKT